MTSNTDPVRALIVKWRRQAAEHGTRTFTGNDHALFANELEYALSQQPAAVDEAWQVQLADALECFWNAALSGVREHDDSTANAVMSGMVQGVAAVADRLRERAAQQEEVPRG